MTRTSGARISRLTRRPPFSFPPFSLLKEGALLRLLPLEGPRLGPPKGAELGPLLGLGLLPGADGREVVAGGAEEGAPTADGRLLVLGPLKGLLIACLLVRCH